MPACQAQDKHEDQRTARVQHSSEQSQRSPSVATKKKHQNRLSHEKSPYLLQHADNPVDWYPWGEEAFAKAKKEDKPVFLSIGYSTCHWCHVMEHESFEVEEVANFMNEYFVSIKVDREERPDLDNIYMSAVMAMTGSGGWPLTVFLTPDKKPFFGGTYFPPYAKWGSPGLIDIMHSINDSWQSDRKQVNQSSHSLTELLKERAPQGERGGKLNQEILTTGFQTFSRMYDSRFGGFGTSPKFPTSHNLSFLLRYWRRTLNPKALEMVEHTLQQMAKGGMYDHIGGGFHRYSTDQQWQIPHFEKMLYDQAILARTYSEAYQITKNEHYAQIAREIFDYALRDMQHTQGGFYSAEDADSLDPDKYAQMTPDPEQGHEKKEGAYYLWRYEEITGLLGQQDAEIFNYHFGIKANGNAHSDPHGEFVGKNIVYVNKSLEETADHFQTSLSEITEVIKRAKEKLLAVRTQRPRPHLDDKILVDWNGLMISSLAFGSRVLHEPKYKNAAEKAALFIINRLSSDENRLLHRYRDGEAGISGTIEDYAFFIHGLLDLYEATFRIEYLARAVKLAENMLELFWDETNGGFYFTADDAEELLFRQKEIYDGAIPSGNSVAALNLVRLYHITLDKQWDQKLEELFQSFANEISQRPSAYAQMLTAVDYAFGPSQEIVIAGPQEDPKVKEMINALYEYFIPNKIVILRVPSGKEAEEIISLAPFVENQLLLAGLPTAYVCENHVCKLPVKELSEFQELLDALNKSR